MTVRFFLRSFFLVGLSALALCSCNKSNGTVDDTDTGTGTDTGTDTGDIDTDYDGGPTPPRRSTSQAFPKTPRPSTRPREGSSK